MQDGEPMNPQRVVWELSKRLPDRCLLTADSGSSTNWWARHLKLRKGMDASLSGTLATMGPAMPYAIGARFAFPDRPIIATIGDGAFQMNGMNGMITIKRYQDRLMAGGAPMVFCVFNNQDLNQVTWEQRVLSGDPKVPRFAVHPGFPLCPICRAVGVQGNLLRQCGQDRRSLGRGPVHDRPAGAVGGEGRSGNAALAAAHQV